MRVTKSIKGFTNEAITRFGILDKPGSSHRKLSEAKRSNTARDYKSREFIKRGQETVAESVKSARRAIRLLTRD